MHYYTKRNKCAISFDKIYKKFVRVICGLLSGKMNCGEDEGSFSFGDYIYAMLTEAKLDDANVDPFMYQYDAFILAFFELFKRYRKNLPKIYIHNTAYHFIRTVVYQLNHLQHNSGNNIFRYYVCVSLLHIKAWLVNHNIIQDYNDKLYPKCEHKFLNLIIHHVHNFNWEDDDEFSSDNDSVSDKLSFDGLPENTTFHSICCVHLIACNEKNCSFSNTYVNLIQDISKRVKIPIFYTKQMHSYLLSETLSDSLLDHIDGCVSTQYSKLTASEKEKKALNVFITKQQQQIELLKKNNKEILLTYQQNANNFIDVLVGSSIKDNATFTLRNNKNEFCDYVNRFEYAKLLAKERDKLKNSCRVSF